MMKKEVAGYLKPAEKALREAGIVKGDDTYEQEYGGRIASFGPSVMLSGLMPTVAFFSDKERAPVGAAILKTIEPNATEKTLLDYLKTMSDAQQDQEKNRILAAVVALKLVMRTFRKEEKAVQP